MRNIISSSNNSCITINGSTIVGEGCVKGNGELATKTLEAVNFSKIRLDGSINVEYVQSNTLAIEITSDSNLIDFVQAEVIGNTLTVGATGSFSTNNRMSVKCSSPFIDDIYLRGSGDVEISTINTPVLNLYVQGSGDISIDDGICDELTATVQGSGDIDTSDLKASVANVQLQGSGDIRVRCEQTISANLMGSGDIKVYGKPTNQRVNEQGSGRIKFK